ncbi:MAG TPA: hypothetical protein VFB55_06705 [Verrucomicrobiae bacterium]|nr:hypothetical protein [Verrucomicrobiae bacterium]
MMGIRLTVLVLSGWLLTAVSGRAMDRWTALSMIESGNNDCAVGACGEISRFQIRPAFWPGGNPFNSRDALAAARQIMRSRIAQFERTHHRAPDNFEFYVLWNAPWQVDHPSRTVAERAQRFVNLVEAAHA